MKQEAPAEPSTPAGAKPTSGFWGGIAKAVIGFLLGPRRDSHTSEADADDEMEPELVEEKEMMVDLHALWRENCDQISRPDDLLSAIRDLHKRGGVKIVRRIQLVPGSLAATAMASSDALFDWLERTLMELCRAIKHAGQHPRVNLPYRNNDGVSIRYNQLWSFGCG